MLAAVQIFNNPQMTFKSESFISLAVIAWTYLLHAYFRGQGVDYRYYRMRGKRKRFDKTKHGAVKLWCLEDCLSNAKCPLDAPTKENLRFLIGIRNEIEHQMTNKVDGYIGAKLQACALNFDDYICRLFGEKYNLRQELSIAIQFAPVDPSQFEQEQDKQGLPKNVRHFAASFEEGLSADTRNDSHYAYKVYFVPVVASKRAQANQVIEFISSDSEEATNVPRHYAVIKETEKKKYLPSEIVKIVKTKGFPQFTMKKHTDLWKGRDAKNPKYHYGVQVAKTWYWYESWLNLVETYCAETLKNGNTDPRKD